MRNMSEKEIVIRGWNEIAPAYHANRNKEKINPELQRFVELLPEKAQVLDVGSGSGIPVAKYLSNAGLKVTGIDISDIMIQMAKKNVPQANFINMDMTEIDFSENQFDGVISVFSLFHVAKKDHFSIFKKFHDILKPGGILLINTGINESEGISNFFGVPMFWSNHAPNKTLELVKKSEFSIIFEGVLLRGGELQYWIYAENIK
ncbi:MAG: class I SAM-dependent methyltransferase [Promethearchaeota archaeon]|nr:MAG: class I SAM-dependent methyltransferase [Candidatus Lokiarchaeota archaeon]